MDQYVRGRKGGLHTRTSNEKVRELWKLSTDEYLKKVKRIYRQGNMNCKDAIDEWAECSEGATVDAAHWLLGRLFVLEPMAPLVEMDMMAVISSV